MSKAKAQEFMLACKNGNKETIALLSEKMKKGTLNGVEETVANAQAAGWDFTVEDVKAAALEAQAEGELSDVELEAVAGGKCDEGCDEFFRVCDSTWD